MYAVTKIIDFCYGHRLRGNGPCRYLHGHNARLEIDVEGDELDERGMVVDFSDLKRDVQQWIDENLDHRMLLQRSDPAVALLEPTGEPLFLLDEPPAADAVCRLIYRQAVAFGYRVAEVRLWETPAACVSYRGE